MTRIFFGATLNLTSEFYSGDWNTLLALTLELEAHGFDSAFVMDHLTASRAWVADNPKTNSGPDFFECWAALAALAASTKKIRVGPLVQCVGYRNPALVAKMAASVDRISGGRLEFSMGAGWKEDEHLSYGYPFPKPSIRMRQLDEALTIIRKMWTEARTSYAGKYFSVTDVELGPLPVQKPHPPIWVGGGGEKLLLRVVAKHADVWDVWCSPEQYRRKLEILGQHCDAVGRKMSSIRLSVSPEVFIDKKSDEAIRRARESTWPGADAAGFIDRRIVGSPEECITQISRYVDMGVRYLTPMIHTMSRSELGLFEEKVMPYFR